MRAAVIAMLIGAVFISACDDDDDDNLVGPVPLTFSGAFVLRTVRDDPLPANVTVPGNASANIIALSGRISIFANGTFTRFAVFQRTIGGVDSTVTVNCTGVWTAVVSTLTLTFAEKANASNCGAVFQGVRTGDQLTTTFLGAPALYTH